MSSDNDGGTSSLDDDWDDEDATPKTEAGETVSPRPARKAESIERGPAWARRLALAAVVLGVLGIGVSIVRPRVGAEAGDRAAAPPPPAPRPSAVVPSTPSPSIAAAPSATPTASTIADAPASASSEKESRPPPPRSYRFDARAARAALDALAPTLTDCRIPKGRSGKVEIVFEPDGHISSSKPLDMYVGTFGGKCVARHLKVATVPPFYGEAKTYTYAFVIPE